MPLVSCPKCEYEFDSRVASCPKCGEVVTAFVRQHAGTLVDGKYRVLQRLGRGGMGEVFKVEHVHLGTTRVIKVMRPQIADEKELQDRFAREARLATLIQHPNVATLHDFSILPDKSCYMVWEYIDGTDLATFAKSTESLDTRLVIQLVIQALRGLEAIHNAGIIHRDISPENIMVSATSSTGIVVKVIDLGIAKSDSADGSLTSTGVFIGKWRYASPEHLGLLEPGEKIDGRADLFSMGIVLYELLAGRLPFDAETPGQYILLHAGDKPSPVTPDRISVPDAPGLETVLAKLLERDRNKRHANAAELISDLERVLEGIPDLDDAPPTMVLTPRPPAEEVPTQPSSPNATPTVRTDAGASTERGSNRPLLIAASIAGLLAVVIGVILVVAVLRMGKSHEVQPRAGLSVPEARPAGEVVDIPAEPATNPVATDTAPVPQPAETAQESVVPEQTETTPTEPPVKPPPVVTPPKPESKPAPVEPPPPPITKTSVPEKEVAEPIPPVPAPPPTPQTDTIPTSGKPMFGWRSKKLVDDPSYKAGFRKGIIRDYSDMWSRGGLDWVAIARGVSLSDYQIKVSPFKNMTKFNDEAMMNYLNVVLQDELNEIAGSEGMLTTENALIWAQERPEFGVAIEMIFRDSSGRVVAKIRHTHYEDSLEDAAQEMVDYVVEFVEDHDVVE